MTQSDLLEECETLFTEDEELEQLIRGETCFKVYPFLSGIISIDLNRCYIWWQLKFKCSYHWFFAETCTSDSERKIILSGSFNPLHDGHVKLLEVATRYVELFQSSMVKIKSLEAQSKNMFRMTWKVLWSAKKSVFLSTWYVFPIRPNILYNLPIICVVLVRVLIISNQPYFYKKAELFPGSAFVIGADTAVRLIDVSFEYC